MTPSIVLLEGKFPEPQFSAMHRLVFAEIQSESPELAAVLAAELAAATPPSDSTSTHAPMIRFGAYVGTALVGWASGHFERGNVYYMASSGVLPEFQNHGVYAALLEATISHATVNGAHVVRSQHSVVNNRIIIIKLKRGFSITGLSTSAQMGTLVELCLHISSHRGALLRTRVIPFVAPN